MKRQGRSQPFLIRCICGLQMAVTLLLLLLLLPLLVPLCRVRYLGYPTMLQCVIWAGWCPRGVNVLLVHSDSPVWQDHMQANVIPRLPSSAVVINWSERRHWRRFSLAVMAARCFGGSEEFNPLVVVFRPFRWAKTYRFWMPFQEFKHGNREPLRALEEKLFSDL